MQTFIFIVTTIDSQVNIPISYTLSDPEGDSDTNHQRYLFPRRRRQAGKRRSQQIPLRPISRHLLLASPIRSTGIRSPAASSASPDNVVFRIVAYPGVRPTANGVAGPYQRPYASATTFPFRVRGTQVQVIESGAPVANALVYRSPHAQAGMFEPIAASPGAPAYTTDAQGFLRGRGQIGIGDQLIALRPISATDVLSDGYRLYRTNIKPDAVGIGGFTVAQSGVQRIDVSAAHPLVLFPLDISLEWDARNDQRFMSQLRSDLARTSEFLFNATNGQAALGEVRIFQDKQWWDAVNMRIYASNRIRPSALVGGMTTQPITDVVSLRAQDPVDPPVVYGPGQLRIGSVWNRFGNANNNLSEDWPRTLAHELGALPVLS